MKFQKGYTPWNKGKEGKNRVEIGTIIVNYNGPRKKRERRRWIKIAHPDKWILYSRWLWINAVGNIPEGFHVHHKNGDKLDDRLENFELVSASRHLEITKQQTPNWESRRLAALRKAGTGKCYGNKNGNSKAARLKRTEHSRRQGVLI